MLMLLLSGKRSFTRKPCLSKNRVFWLFFLFSHFFAFVACLPKGKKKGGGEDKTGCGRKTYSRNDFLLVSLCLGFHNPGELHVLQRRFL